MTIKTSTSLTPNPLSFPAHVFAKLSPGHFLQANLTSPQRPTRPSGRLPLQYRSPACTTSSLSYAYGSAVVRIGDTAVVCGVRGEILKVSDIADYQPLDADSTRKNESWEGNEGERMKRRADTDEMARLNLLVPNIELATGCSPGNLPGGPPSAQAQALSQRVLVLLHTSHLINIDDLKIWYHPPATSSSPSPDQMDVSVTADNTSEGDLDPKPEIKGFWTLYIDIIFISLDGNPFDAAWLALLAALVDVRLPRAWWDTDHDMVLCDPDAAQYRRLQIGDLPVALSYGVFMPKDTREKDQKWVLVDMDGFEEAVCEESGSIVVRNNAKGTEVLRFEKCGGGGVGLKEMRELVELAALRCEEWKTVLDGIMEQGSHN